MNARAEQRRAELWLEQLQSRPAWSLSAALLWISYRDFEVMKRWLRDDAGPAILLPEAGELNHAATIRAVIEADPQAIEPLPEPTLLLRLQEGNVQSLGIATKPQAWSNNTVTDDEPTPISAAEWQTHRWGPWYARYLTWEIARLDEQPFLLHRDWKWSDEFSNPRRYWSRVKIDRASLIQAFPPRPHKATTAGALNAERDLREAVSEHLKSPGQNPIPVAAAWLPDADTRFAISKRQARGVWDKVAREFPALSDPTGKPKRRRSG
jgi:hypothetical protein